MRLKDSLVAIVFFTFLKRRFDDKSKQCKRFQVVVVLLVLRLTGHALRPFLRRRIGGSGDVVLEFLFSLELELKLVPLLSVVEPALHLQVDLLLSGEKVVGALPLVSSLALGFVLVGARTADRASVGRIAEVVRTVLDALATGENFVCHFSDYLSLHYYLEDTFLLK